jgi:hypothetical protein
MTGLWSKWKELIQSGLTAPGQVIKVPSVGSYKVRKGRGFDMEKPFYFTQSSKAFSFLPDLSPVPQGNLIKLITCGRKHRTLLSHLR